MHWKVYLMTRFLLGWHCMAGFVPKMGKSQKIVKGVRLLHRKCAYLGKQRSDRGRANTMQLPLNSLKRLCKKTFSVTQMMLYPLRKSVLKTHSMSIKRYFLLFSYCLVELKYEYVLLGKFQSDPIERRFSWLRQLSGGNFYISVRQLLENEKKIRATSLLKFSRCSLTEIRSLGNDENQSENLSRKVATFSQSLADVLLMYHSSLESSDAHIICYITGALVHALLERSGCSLCRDILVGSTEKLPLSTVSGEIAPDAKDFIKRCNRGGLVNPSAAAFGICVKCWMIYTAIQETPALWKQFLQMGNHRTVFCTAAMEVISEDAELEDILVNRLSCERRHNFAENLVSKFFNCMASNTVKRLSEKQNASDVSKIRKLNSQ